VYVDLPGDLSLMAQLPSSQAIKLAPGDKVKVGVEDTPVLVIAG
jgi:protein involved in polysaccharide export with SLBB domain